MILSLTCNCSKVNWHHVQHIEIIDSIDYNTC